MAEVRKAVKGMRYEHVAGGDPEFIALCHGLDDFLNHVAGGEENRAQYLPHNRTGDLQDVILAYDGDLPVGCAGYKRYDSACAEIKRVFVREGYRGRGISKRLLKLLEASARKNGYSHFILESGEPLTAAMRLYRSLGFVVIPNYGPYADMQASVCMRKRL